WHDAGLNSRERTWQWESRSLHGRRGRKNRFQSAEVKRDHLAGRDSDQRIRVAGAYQRGTLAKQTRRRQEQHGELSFHQYSPRRTGISAPIQCMRMSTLALI